MTLMECHDVAMDYAGEAVLRRASFAIAEGEKLGVVGPNGAGKSTLCRLLLGEEEPTGGRIVRARVLRTAYVAQERDRSGNHAESAHETGICTPDRQSDLSLDVADHDLRSYLMADVLALRSQLRGAEEALASVEPDELQAALASYQRIRDEYDAVNGDDAEISADRLLSTFGLTYAADTPLTRISGGERNILDLGRALMQRPDLLVLDEPGNHLDFAGLAWLEEFLRSFRGAVLIVSHNRYLLDRVVDGVIEIEHGQTTRYAGGYSEYQAEKLQKAVAAGARHQAAQKKLARLEALVERFAQIAKAHPDPSWGRRLRARRTQLEKAKASAEPAPALERKAPEISFNARAGRARIALDIREHTVRRGGVTLLRRASLFMEVGERVGLVGPNGSGKTSLLSDIVGDGCWDHPTLRVGPSQTVAYCAQHQEMFRPDATVLEEMERLRPMPRGEAARILERYLFRDRDLDTRIRDLSGGERNRLQLARASLLGADFLVLDEPTNHLDIPAREAVEDALCEFAGTILVVSHDRYLLDAVVDRVVELRDLGLQTYPGGFTEFWAKRGRSLRGKFGDRRGGAEGSSRRKPHGGAATGAPRGGESSTRGAPGGGARGDAGTRSGATGGTGTGSARPATGKAGAYGKPPAPRPESEDTLEDRILELEAQKEKLEAEMARAFERRDHRRGKSLGAELRKIRRRIEELYERFVG